MADGVLGTKRVHSSAIVVLGLAQYLDTDIQRPPQMLDPPETHSNQSQAVRAFTSRAPLDRVCLVVDAGPSLADSAHMYVDVAKAIVVVGGVFVVDASFHVEARGWDIGHDPFRVPGWIGALPYRRGAQLQWRVFFVSTGSVGVQFGDDEGVGGQSVDVCEGEVRCAMEGDLDCVARGRPWYRRVVEATRWTLLFTRARPRFAGLEQRR